MNPAFSVIFFTTLCGAAQGLFVVVFAVDVASQQQWIGDPGASFFVTGALLAAALAALGLAASFFHLGHPERAWRAAAQWRTSWLSREVIALPVFLACLLAYAGAHRAGHAAILLLGTLTLVACVVLFICTGMIYACIRFLQEWASPLTLVNFVLLGLASGATLASVIAGVMAPSLIARCATSAIVLTLAALVFRIASLRRNARLRPKSTLQTAIGVRHPRIEQKAQGATGGSFNTREFFHGASPRKMRTIKWSFLGLAFAAPVLLLAAGVTTRAVGWLAVAFVAQYLGLLAERWYFFAQANHPQNLYYQAIS